jgi:hypothetical protein
MCSAGCPASAPAAGTEPAIVPGKAAGAGALARISIETVSNMGGLQAIGPGGRPGGAQGKRDDQGRDDLSALFSPQV